MKRLYLPTQIWILPFLLSFCTFCEGQAKTSVPGKNVITPKTSSTGTPKLIKNHFTNKYHEAADNVHCGFQDKAGNLWFGTTGDGVYRYDGKSFTNFTMRNGLDTNQILSMLEDRVGNIWFGTRNGICRFDGQGITQVAIPSIYPNSFYPSGLPGNSLSGRNAVWSIMQDKNGTLWFGTEEGVYCLNGKVFTRFLDNTNIINKGGLTLKSVQCMLQDTKGNTWFGSGPMAFEGICLYAANKLSSFKPKSQQWIRKILETKSGIIYFATRSAGIYYHDPSAHPTGDKQFTPLPMPAKFINGSMTNILEDKAGSIWLASDYGENPGDSLGGLWRSRSSSDKMSEKTFTKATNKEVFFILEDKDNSIWIGTRGTGLYRYDKKGLTNFSE